jgi:methionine--tRNA ligase beta chain
VRYVCDNQRHLVCVPFSVKNLHIMAESLNIKRCWFHNDHYDMPKRRVEEIAAHCERVSPKEIVSIIKEGRAKMAENEAGKKTIKIEEFTADIRIGNIMEVKPHPNADKLLVLQVRFGEETRQIVAGIKQFYDPPEKLIGKQAAFVVNLEPRKVRGEMSNGMILAASDGNNNLALLTPDKPIASGSQVR